MLLRRLCHVLMAVAFSECSVCVAESCTPVATPLTFQILSAKIEECQIRRMEDLLPLLPPDFRSRYVFVYASRSLQGATPLFPRVILFGLDATFILTFAGDPHLEGYESLETVEFDKEQKKFRFRSITFPAEKEQTREASLKRPVISEVNPSQCQVCHRQDPRPNWDTYQSWPGVYGSRNDVMPGPEEEQYEKFKNQVFLKIGRYRFFEDADKYPDNAWYYDYYRNERPNLQFSWLLSLLNSQANSREIRTNPELYPFRYTLLASLTCHDDFHDANVLAELIPPSITRDFSKSYSEISKEVKRSIEASHAEREKRQLMLLSSLGSKAPMAKWNTDFPREELEFVGNTARFRYVMELARVPFPQWSMEFGSRNYVFFAGPVGEIGELGLFLWQDLLDPIQDSELYQIYSDAWEDRRDYGLMKFWYGKEDLCKGLRKKSRETLQAYKNSSSPQRLSSISN